MIAKTRQNNEGGPVAAKTIDALNFLVNSGAQVINLSSGFTPYFPTQSEDCTTHATDPLCLAIDFARRREVIFVAASGNDSWATEAHFPAYDPNVIGVAASDVNDVVWHNPGLGSNSGSNLGRISIVAPGKDIVSTNYVGGTWCLPNGHLSGYSSCTGTSFATPHVSAAFAVLRSINPLLTVSELKSTVITTANMVDNPSAGAGHNGMPEEYPRLNLRAAVDDVLNDGFVWPAFAFVTNGSQSDRFVTTSPQMARAAIDGTMRPQPLSGTAATYTSDPNAPLYVSYPSFPDPVLGAPAPRAFFYVFTKFKQHGGIVHKPLYRLSKVQNVANNRDECNNLMPVPSKAKPVIHRYTTEPSTRDQLTTSAYCYKYDGIEGYVSPSNTGTLQQLYQIYNPTADSYILVPSSKVSLANSLGYNQQQTLLGWVVPN